MPMLHRLPIIAVLSVLSSTATGAAEPSRQRSVPAWQTSWATTVFHAGWGRPQRLPSPALMTAAGPERGIASFYWQEQMTASGERFDKTQLTAAHRTLPLGTRVRVTHAGSGKTVIVRINDRGPFKAGRIIDLSDAAAELLGMRAAGLAQVTVEVVP